VMSIRRPERQADLLQRVVSEAEREKLPPEARAAVIDLLKVLLTTCAAEVARARATDE
jgi:chorismate mutase